MHQLRAIQRALEKIEQRLTEPLELEALARQVGMSFWHFQRTFAAMVGEPVGGYIRRRRLTEAARRLRADSRTILDVALEYQFESHEAFTRAFKSEMRATPSAWRSGRVIIKTSRRPAQISIETINQRFQHMKLTPEIVTLPSRSFAGLQTRFIMAASPDSNNLEVLPKLWDEFNKRSHEVPNTEPAVAYGLSNCAEGAAGNPSRPDEAVYLASVHVEKGTKPPREMVIWNSPGGTFAKFTHRGRIERIAETLSYIYGKWLPGADYERGRGPDIERYDSRFNAISDTSVLEFFVPLQAKKRKA